MSEIKKPPEKPRAIFHLRLSDGWTSLVPAKVRNYGKIIAYQFLLIHSFLSIYRHGLTRQGQKICAVKPGLRTGKRGLAWELIAQEPRSTLDTPPKQGAGTLGILFQKTLPARNVLFWVWSLIPKNQDQNPLTGESDGKVKNRR